MDTLLAKADRILLSLTKGGGGDHDAGDKTHPAGQENVHARRTEAHSRLNAIFSALKREGFAEVPGDFRILPLHEKVELGERIFGGREGLRDALLSLGSPGQGDQPNRTDMAVENMPKSVRDKYEGVKTKQTDPHHCYYCGSETTFKQPWSDSAERWVCTFHDAKNREWRKGVGLEWQVERVPI